MKKVITLGALCVIFMVATPGAFAQTAFTLNKIETENSQKSALESEGEVYYTLFEEVFYHPEFKAGAQFNFSLANGETKELRVVKKTEYIPGYISIIAAENGETDNVFSLTYSEGKLVGQYHVSHERTEYLRFNGEVNQNYISTKRQEYTRFKECGIHEGAASFNHLTNYSSKAKAQSSDYSPAPLYASVDDSITIDLMLVYTNAAEVWASESGFEDIDALLAQSVNLSQTALDNSDLGIEMRLVHVYKTDYDEQAEGVEDGDHLNRLTQNSDDPVFDSEEGFDGYMEEIHDLRDQYGADIVSMILELEEVGGLGWAPTSTSGEPRMGFNINWVGQIGDTYTLIHEIGHNMGNSHSRTQVQSAADESGGMFQYSVGFQDDANEFHTVMAYADGEMIEAPIFSSPDLTWQGNTTGSADIYAPADNARSMKEIKRTIASYRPTMGQSPVAAISTDNISVDLGQNEELYVAVDISNTGESGLVWDADFDFASNTIQNKRSLKNENSIARPILSDVKRTPPANYSDQLLKSQKNASEQVIYSSSFENGEGFENGNSVKAISDWRAGNGSDFSISTENPNSGSQHFRLSSGDEVKFINSPFFGYQLFGTYEVTMSVSVSDIGETTYIDFIDGKTGELSSGFLLSDGFFFAADTDETGAVLYFSTEGSYSEDEYNEVKIVYNPTNETINYYLNGEEVYQSSYLAGGYTPSLIQFTQMNNVAGAHLDIDDIEIKRVNAPYSWLSVSSMTGVTFESQTSEIGLTFNTDGVELGTYETMLKVRTNDPNNPSIEVPVTLNVGEGVSNEPQENPYQVTLDQNYPNPFNPSTVISYTLANAEAVQLDVFNMKGQKVMTLQNEKVAAGSHQLTFDASTLASGIYIYRLRTPSKTLTRQMVLIK